MKKNPLNFLMVIGFMGIVTAAIAAYAGTPMRAVNSFEVICDTTATLINNGAGGYNSVRCANTETEQVIIGGPAADANMGYPICSGDTCADAAITVDASQVVYCIALAATPIRCIAGK